MPGAEHDCAKCHTDTRWKVASRLACGTCHDNVFFDTGTLTPPTRVRPPDGGRLHQRQSMRRLRRLRHLRHDRGQPDAGLVLPQDASAADRRRAVHHLPSRRRARIGAGLGGALDPRRRRIAGPRAHQRRALGRQRTRRQLRRRRRHAGRRLSARQQRRRRHHAQERRRALGHGHPLGTHRRSPARLWAADHQVARHAHLRRDHVRVHLSIAVSGHRAVSLQHHVGGARESGGHLYALALCQSDNK